MGIINFLGNDIFMPVLEFFFRISQNYGIAIILLTVAVRLALYPLTVMSTQQMKAMQKLQPKIKELQAKHKKEPQKIQKEMMLLYKQHGVNPLGGCLPMLLQIPFFIALFVVLRSQAFIDLIQEPGLTAWNTSFLWITNLAERDPLYIMVVLIGITTYWSQKAMSPDPSQKQMMMFMPLFIAVISASFPAGVQLYWVVSNLLMTAQQAYILKHKV